MPSGLALLAFLLVAVAVSGSLLVVSKILRVVSTRNDGINYYGIETLNIELGSGDDVLAGTFEEIAAGSGAHGVVDVVVIVEKEGSTFSSSSSTSFLRTDLSSSAASINMSARLVRGSMLCTSTAYVLSTL